VKRYALVLGLQAYQIIMKRNKMQNLIKWKEKKNKNPLLLLGARQVGKTYILKEFAKKYYNDFIYINFEHNSVFKEMYKENLDPVRIIEEIELYFNKKINPNDTLIFFDEIQLSDKAVTALKYFAEQTPEYDIVCAGSLLGVAVQRESFSFPVGKVDFHYLYPFKFDEFLCGIGYELLVEKIIDCYHNNSEMPTVIHEKILKLYKQYLCIGGMPAAINEFVSKGLDLVAFDRMVQENIINAYIADMSKYTTGSEAVKVQAIYKSIPEQLAGDNKKFKYSVVEKGAKASRFGSAIEWLILSRTNLECSLIKRPEFPLIAYKEKGHFKIYHNDVGLLMSMGNIPFRVIMLSNEHNLFKGAVTENYVAQQLKSNNDELFYWKSKTHEVDFIAQINDNIIPVEVKAGDNKRSRSLNEYIKLYSPKYAIRLSAKNFGLIDGIKSIPLYAAFGIL